MRIAIPEWDGYVSPVLDAAGRLLVIDPGREGEARPDAVILAKGDAVQRALQLVALRIDMLICCSISHALEAALVSRGVRVVRHICGPVDAVVTAYRSGGIIPQNLIMPGCQVPGRTWEQPSE